MGTDVINPITRSRSHHKTLRRPMTYIIEYEQKKGTWARSYNPTKTMQHSRSLNHYEFTDRSLAEWEAKEQMSSGTNFAYRVTEVREISDEADFDPLGVDEALASLTDAIAREYENDKNNDYSKQIKELNERVDKVGSSSLAALMSANEDHKHYVAVTEEIIDAANGRANRAEAEVKRLEGIISNNVRPAIYLAPATVKN